MSRPVDEVSVCFVCLGNICRSPTAEGVFRALVDAEGMTDAIHIDSAGTGAWHAGEPADARARAAAGRRGVQLTSRARQVEREDFDRLDLLVAMDHANVADLRAQAPESLAEKIVLFRGFDPAATGREVPDPYYGGEDGFEEVLDLCEAASRGLLMHLRARLQERG